MQTQAESRVGLDALMTAIQIDKLGFLLPVLSACTNAATMLLFCT
jgi:hypothetical protein